MPTPDKPLPDNVLAALQHGNIIEAIKLLRESTGLRLKEAKDLIDQHLHGRPTPLAAASSPRPLPPDVAAALHRGNKIEAIRLLREATGLGLKEAKDAIESVQSRSEVEPGKLSPGEVPRSSVGIWLVVVVAVLALIAYYFFGRPG